VLKVDLIPLRWNWLVFFITWEDMETLIGGLLDGTWSD
jgi:hypothetical protein